MSRSTTSAGSSFARPPLRGGFRYLPISGKAGSKQSSERRGGRAIAAVEPAAPTDKQATAALAEVRDSIDELDQIAGRLARSAIPHGASWSDVGSALRIDPIQAEKAYGPTPGSLTSLRSIASENEKLLDVLTAAST